MKLCPCSDDKGVKCQVEMTEEEDKQDGMCYRCADLIWGFLQKDTPVIYKNPCTREF